MQRCDPTRTSIRCGEIDRNYETHLGTVKVKLVIHSSEVSTIDLVWLQQ